MVSQVVLAVGAELCYLKTIELGAVFEGLQETNRSALLHYRRYSMAHRVRHGILGASSTTGPSALYFQRSLAKRQPPHGSIETEEKSQALGLAAMLLRGGHFNFGMLYFLRLCVRPRPSLFVAKAVTRAQLYFINIGVWPNGKAPVFGTGYSRFES